MKKFWLKVLSCFMAVNFMFMCFATSVLAGKVNYRLNGKSDGLDVVLNAISEKSDWVNLDKICGKGMFDADGNYTQKYYDDNDSIVTIYNKEIRSNYGNTIINIWRRLFGQMEYKPGYGKILVATAEKLGIKNIPEELSVYQVEAVEQAIIAKMVENIRDGIIKEKGYSEWEKIEKDAMGKLDELFEQGKISAGDYESVKKYGVAGVLTGLGGIGLAGSLSGLAAYYVTTSVFWAVAGSLGITGTMLGGVTAVSPVLASLVGVVVNPWFWGLAPIVAVIAVGETNWQKTVGSVFYIALMRQKLQAEGKL